MPSTGLLMPLAWLASAAAFAQADPEAATCPPAVANEQRASAPVPPGWEAATDGDASHTLMGITIFAGPPSQHASLVGDEHAGGKGRKVVTWTLSAAESYWVGCSYSRTNIILGTLSATGAEELLGALRHASADWRTAANPEDRVPLNAGRTGAGDSLIRRAGAGFMGPRSSASAPPGSSPPPPR